MQGTARAGKTVGWHSQSCLCSSAVIRRNHGSEKLERKIGGAGRNRTADKGFADLCLTTWRPRPTCDLVNSTRLRGETLTHEEPNHSHTKGAPQPSLIATIMHHRAGQFRAKSFRAYRKNQLPGAPREMRTSHPAPEQRKSRRVLQRDATGHSNEAMCDTRSDAKRRKKVLVALRQICSAIRVECVDASACFLYDCLSRGA